MSVLFILREYIPRCCNCDSVWNDNKQLVQINVIQCVHVT